MKPWVTDFEESARESTPLDPPSEADNIPAFDHLGRLQRDLKPEDVTCCSSRGLQRLLKDFSSKSGIAGFVKNVNNGRTKFFETLRKGNSTGADERKMLLKGRNLFAS